MKVSQFLEELERLGARPEDEIVVAKFKDEFEPNLKLDRVGYNPTNGTGTQVVIS